MTEFDLLSEDIRQILNFQGYGSPSAPVWFIGIEEGLGNMDDRDARMNLRSRASFQNTMDMYKAHLQLHEGGRPINIEQKLPSTQVWQYMAKIMQAYNGDSEWKNKKLYKDYIRFKLGRCEGDTFLTELSPIPASSTANKNWINVFRKKEPNLDVQIMQRKAELKRMLKENDPNLTVCYGLARMGDFAELLDVEWRLIRPKIYASHDSRCLLLPFFGNGQMSNAVIETLLECGLLKSGRAVTKS